MGQWCNCVECVGYQDEPTEEELKMDQAIQLVSDDDLIALPDGGFLPRSSMDPELLEGDPNGYRVIPVNSPEWIALRSQAS